jgi:hypothetical protein
MGGELITLPLRIGIRSTRLFFRVAEDVAGRAVQTTLRLVHTLTPERDGATAARTAHQPVRETPTPAAPTEPAARVTAADGAPSRPTAPREGVAPRAEDVAPPEPVHVSAEPALVLEAAEEGAEEGAGAAVTVREPWEGYGRMTAREVIAHVADASAAELAAVQLYESAHRGRQSVQAAVERRLKSISGRGAANHERNQSNA